MTETERMNKLENLLCIFCRNSTIISTEKPADVLYNKSTDDGIEKTNMYSICPLCNKYSYIKVGTLLYNENFLKIQNINIDIKYDPKLIQLKQYCSVCKDESIFKMFYSDEHDIKAKYICTTCDTFFNV